MSSAALFEDPRTVRRGRLEFVPLGTEHLFALERQDSQRTQYGVDLDELSWQEAQALCDDGGWCALRDGEPIACMGIRQTFPEAQGVAWALLGKGIGRDHHRLTRFARDEIVLPCPLARLEAIVRCADPPEAPRDVGQLQLMTWCLQHPTPQVRWALAVGLQPVAVLRKFGAANETHMLLERIL